MRRLQAAAPEWSFKITALEDMRAANHRERLAPVIVAGTVSAFLLLMVALGLTGVLWQNVTQRMREIGLRRAKGATAGHIHRQILGEVAVMTSFAVAVFPPALVGHALRGRDALILVPAVSLSACTVAAAIWSIGRRDIPLEAAQ